MEDNYLVNPLKIEGVTKIEGVSKIRALDDEHGITKKIAYITTGGSLYIGDLESFQPESLVGNIHDVAYLLSGGLLVLSNDNRLSWYNFAASQTEFISNDVDGVFFNGYFKEDTLCVGDGDAGELSFGCFDTNNGNIDSVWSDGSTTLYLTIDERSLYSMGIPAGFESVFKEGKYENKVDQFHVIKEADETILYIKETGNNGVKCFANTTGSCKGIDKPIYSSIHMGKHFYIKSYADRQLGVGTSIHGGLHIYLHNVEHQLRPPALTLTSEIMDISSGETNFVRTRDGKLFPVPYISSFQGGHILDWLIDFDHHDTNAYGISTTKLYTATNTGNPNVELIRSDDDDLLEKIGIVQIEDETYYFIKTKNKCLYFGNDIENLNKICDVPIDDLVAKKSAIIVKVSNAFYAIGYVRKYLPLSTDSILSDRLKICESEEHVACRFRKVNVEGHNVTEVIVNNDRVVFLTKEGNAYGKGHNRYRSLKDSDDRVVNGFVLLNDDSMNRFKVCKVFNTYGGPIYIYTCNGHFYQRGYSPISTLRLEGGRLLFDEDYVKEIPLEENTKPIVVDSSAYNTMILTSSNALDCIQDDCIVKEDIKIINTDVIIEDGELVISSNVNISDSHIIVQPREGKTPIIVDGGNVSLNSTKLTYRIDSKQILEDIKDGDRIVIIEAINGGTIEGEFSEVVLDYEVNRKEECEVVNARIEYQ